MSKRVIELRQQYNQAVKLMRDLHEAAEKEKRGFTTDEQAQYDEARKGLDGLKERIEREEQLTSEELRTAQPVNPRDEGTLADPDARAAMERGDKRADDPVSAAFRTYLLNGNAGLSAEQRNALAAEKRDMSLSVAAGGYTVPQGFYARLVETQRNYGAFLNPGLCTILDTDSGNTIPVPLEDDTANAAAIVAEGASLTTSTDPTFNSVNLGAFTYRALARVSLELLQDSAFDLEAYLARKLGIRLVRGFNAHASTGTNSGQPQGLFNASVGASIGATAATGNTTNFPYISLVALEHSVDPDYRATSSWMFSDGVLQALKQQLDTTGRPIWMPNYAPAADLGTTFTRFPGTILGYRYVVNQDAPAMAANARCAAFGDFSYYMVRRVRQMMMVRASERFIDSGQIGFYLFARLDGKYANPTATAARAPIRLGQNSAT